MKNTYRRSLVWILATTLVLVGTVRMAVYAGLGPMPLEAEMDLAEKVVVGTITATEVTGKEHDGGMLTGKATVAVDETLKGPAGDSVIISVVLQLDPQLARSMASPRLVCKAGDSGIWLIRADGRLSHSYGLLSRDRLKEVKDHLAMLKERKWSEPVDGIAVWCGAMKRASAFGDFAPPVVFAVRNVGEKPVQLPLPLYQGVVRVVARDEKGKEITLQGYGRQLEPDQIICEPLEPGEVAYMHPDCRNDAHFRFPKDTQPGTYAIQGTLSNDQEVGKPRGLRGERVQLWRGTVTSPATAAVVGKIEEQKR